MGNTRIRLPPTIVLPLLLLPGCHRTISVSGQDVTDDTHHESGPDDPTLEAPETPDEAPADPGETENRECEGLPVALEELDSRFEELMGETIVIEGQVRLGLHTCTCLECREDNPCCNGCGAAIGFWPPFYILDTPDRSWGCSGTNCEMECTPFGPHEVIRVSATPFLFTGGYPGLMVLELCE